MTMKMRMHKGVGCITALLLVMALLVGCGEEAAPVRMPEPSEATIEASENSFGARYRFTLDAFTEKIADDLEEMNLTPFQRKWETLSDGLVDDNGVKYTSYCNRVKGITFTAAVEDQSKKVMNIGCGCESEKLENETFREKFIRLAARIAAHSGGFDENDLNGLVSIFEMLMDDSEDILCFGDTLYIKSVDEETTVLMTAPCSGEVVSRNHYKIITDTTP